ncbi:hypothetical protein AK830_g160 [Neonectria ditissima]|uniref:Zn(2)-C6 fungal-type domain-containing protein n=1 Tax=Neonectria ditissima TaxID=78410 RepID=A0A0P7BXX1_9HYPO|nr:hypothetical protein AK830_g160 [Neonectria ditissima]
MDAFIHSVTSSPTDRPTPIAQMPKPRQENNQAKATKRKSKRAKKACLSCRKRKVRCDVSQRGPPCMNCFLDGDDCVVAERSARRRLLTSCDHAAEASERRECCGQQPMTLGNEVLSTGIWASISDGLDLPHLDGTQPSIKSKIDAIDGAAELCTKRGRPGAWVPFESHSFLSTKGLGGLDTSESRYLDAQTCFQVPNRTILDEFMRAYFIYIHPLFPLLDEGAFWDMYYDRPRASDEPERRMSLLVVQAMLFAACTFVSREAIERLGYKDPRLARATLYRKAKLLHDFDVELSPASRSQATLLLSYWATSSPQAVKQRNSTWLDIAIRNARMAGAHNYASSSEGPTALTRNALKRLWWCCVLRDRILALCCRRSIQITPLDFDFDTHQPLDSSDLESEFNSSLVYGTDTKKQLAEILHQTLELCVSLTRILLMTYSPKEGLDTKHLVLSDEQQKLAGCWLALRRWRRLAAGQHAHSPLKNSQSSLHESISLCKNLMLMYYHTARAALCHHEIKLLADPKLCPEKLGGRDVDSDAPEQPLINLCTSRHELQDSMMGVTECLRDLYSKELLHRLPVSAVACTALPLILHALDAKLEANTRAGSVSSAASHHRLSLVLRAITACQERYDSVDFVGRTAHYIMEMAQTGRVLVSSMPQEVNGTRWAGLLETHPTSYLRLILVLDSSLSKDRLPDEEMPLSSLVDPLLQFTVGSDCTSTAKSPVSTPISSDPVLDTFPSSCGITPQTSGCRTPTTTCEGTKEISVDDPCSLMLGQTSTEPQLDDISVQEAARITELLSQDDCLDYFTTPVGEEPTPDTPFGERSPFVAPTCPELSGLKWLDYFNLH